MEDPSLVVGKWRLIERWHGLEHRLSRHNNFLATMRKWGCYYEEVDYLLKQTDVRSLSQQPPSERSSPKKQQPAKERKLLSSSSSKPGSQLSRKRQGSHQQLAMRHCSQRQRKLLVKKLQQPLLISHDPTRMAELIVLGLSSQLASTTKLNKELAVEVSDMNHQATNFAEKLSTLRQSVKVQSTSLSQAKSKVLARQQEVNKEVESRVAGIEAEVAEIRKELDKKQRMNDLQNSKVQLAQEELSALQATLKMKERERQQMKRWTKEERDQSQLPHQVQQSSQEKASGDSDSSVSNKNSVSSPYLAANPSDRPDPVSNAAFEASQDTYEGEHSENAFPSVFLGPGTPSICQSQDSEGELPSTGASPVKHNLHRSVSQTVEQLHVSLSDTSLDSVSSHGSLKIRRGRLTGSAKKRFASFTEKTRRLMLEEGKVFRKAHNTKALPGDETDVDSPHKPSSSRPVDPASGPLESSQEQAETPFPARNNIVKSNTVGNESHRVVGKNDEDHNEGITKECDLNGEEGTLKANEEDLTHCEDGEEQQLLVKSEGDASKENAAPKNQASDLDQSYFAKINLAMNAKSSQVAPLSPATSLLNDIMDSLESLKRDRSDKPLPTSKGGILSKKDRRPSIVRLPTQRRVRFTPESLILSAALEGDLALLRQCVLQLGGCSVTSEKGATCLHNAVCSGNFHAMEYLIELGCDINAMDSDGWTPLHCAVAYCNLSAIQLLIKHGASLFLQNSDGQTPFGIIHEDVEGVEELIDDVTRQCYVFLNRVHKELGVIDSGRVHTLFSYVAVCDDELSFVEGEQLTILSRDVDSGWWRAKNARRQTGYVPFTYLGLYPRFHVVV